LALLSGFPSSYYDLTGAKWIPLMNIQLYADAWVMRLKLSTVGAWRSFAADVVRATRAPVAVLELVPDLQQGNPWKQAQGQH
jgi:hypothetical protein